MTLEAARDSLLGDARAAARRRLDEAEADARARVEAAARRDADETIARARAQGEAEGRVEAAHEDARERAFARMDVLAAQREAYDELRRRAREAALAACASNPVTRTCWSAWPPPRAAISATTPSWRSTRPARAA